MSATAQDTISAEAAKAEFLRAKDRLLKCLSHTPDDKINWSPAATARTPIEIVGHSGMSIKGMQGWLDGQPFPFESMKALDDYCRDQEKDFKTRDQVTSIVEEHSANFIKWLDSLSAEKLSSTFETQMGNFPMMAAITFPADHLRSHAAQIEYIQTIFGDRDMHMG